MIGKMFFMIVIMLSIVGIALAEDETIELTTYYPAPYGDYDSISLTPTSTADAPTPYEGLIYYDSDTDEIKIYGEDPTGSATYGWKGIGSGNGIWSLNGTNAYYNDGSVGIGTDTPNSNLHIKGNDADITLDLNTGSGTSNTAKLGFFVNGAQKGNIYWNKANNKLYLTNRGSGSNKQLIFDQTGKMGIGMNPAHALDVNGDIRTSGGRYRTAERDDFYMKLQSDRNMVLYDAGGSYGIWSSGTAISDINLKNNITDLGSVLNMVDNLSAIRFYYNEGVYDDKPHIGLIAQEVEKHFPELVYTIPPAANKLIHYDKIAPILLQAVKELRAEKDKEIKDLRDRIKVLEDLVVSTKL